MLFGLYSETSFSDHRDYVEKWRKGMEEAYAIATENAKKAAEKSKRHYDTTPPSAVAPPPEPPTGDHLGAPDPDALVTTRERAEPADYEPAPPSPPAPKRPEEIPQQPQRERHPPRRMTDDQLGTPSCYSVQPAQPLLSVYQGLAPWLPALQPYYGQPIGLNGLQQM
ncbi:hypothetical protein XENOCAPTIV_022027 [Xenoophorus captivus]|uniref:Uncharacterized protein n=1 Tax=Xenoophorus captivus TaxID=1517983 RepID=A0ABV0SGI6_9TELE